MKQLAIVGKLRAEVRTAPDPRIRGNFVRVKVHSAPLCTEFKAFANGEMNGCLGHEASGEVVEVAQPGRVKVGDRVAVMPQYPCGLCELCQSGDYIHCEHGVDPLRECDSSSGTATYAEYLIKQDWLLVPLPETMSYDHGALACCGLGATFGAIENMSVNAFDTLLVVGLGPVGLGAIIHGVYRGAKVIGVESNPYRTKLALELGAKEIIDPRDSDALKKILDLTGGRGVDKAVDCTAVPAAQKLAIDATRRKGHVSFVGWGGNIQMDNMVPRGLTLQGSWHWNIRHRSKMIRLIENSGKSIDKFITHTFPMSACNEAFELQLTGQCGKVILHPQE